MRDSLFICTNNLNMMIKLKFPIAIGFLILFFLSCSEDDPINIPTTPMIAPPSINLVEGVDVISSDATIDAGSSFTVSVSASAGDDPLRDIKIQQDGADISFDRIAIDGVAAAANPILLVGDDKDGFEKMYQVTASTDVITSTYSFIVTSETGDAATASVSITTISEPPSLTIEGSDTIVTNPGELRGINLNGAAGGANLTTIAVYENEVLIEDLDRLAYGMTTFDSNPYSLPETDTSELSENLSFRTSDSLGTVNVRVELTDAAGQTVSAEFVYINGEMVTSLMGVLFNAGGPTGTGGLDLDEGMGIGSSDETAEIKDEGIDTDLVATENWRKQISGVNGSVLKALIPGQNGLAEGFDFDGIQFQNSLVTFFENGVDFTEMNADGELVSNLITAGDLFAVQNGEKYYIIRISEVNETMDDNGDNYVVDIKF